MPGDISLDSIDHRLVEILLRDARRTVADMASDLALSATAVARRLKRLQSSGVIRGYSARVDYSKLGMGIEALIDVRFVGKTRPKVMDEVTAQLPEVIAVFTTSGNYDALVWVRTRNVDHLRDVIDKLRVIPDVVDTRSHIVLASHFADAATRI
jgi:Lrp/AsnC family transcriptional regulator, leucine-responsive regulatory protein